MTTLLDRALTPTEIVRKLDEHIIGQTKAKRAVAIALRNRWRRQQLAADLQHEVVPKNILMIGPTGVGKTEIARRLAKLVDAPFIKVEASKFTEVGYVGRDVESIIRDLAEEGLRLVRDLHLRRNEKRSQERARSQIIKQLEPHIPTDTPEFKAALTRLEQGFYDQRQVDIEIQEKAKLPFEVMGLGPGMEEMERNFRDMLGQFVPKQARRSRLFVPEALKILDRQEAERLLDEQALKQQAVDLIENHAIVFLDEIDKIASAQSHHAGPDISGQGVQRDLLPIVEGSTVQTKLGPIETDHILFIAAGAFHTSKPSDLIPELQGRFPIRVELDALTEEDFIRILQEPKASLLKQAQALLKTEGVDITFDTTAVGAIAQAAALFNQQLENIGARRLHTIIERLLEELSFNAPDLAGQTIPITKIYVEQRLQAINENRDLAKYIL